jgi:hypothetical protein
MQLSLNPPHLITNSQRRRYQTLDGLHLFPVPSSHPRRGVGVRIMRKSSPVSPRHRNESARNSELEVGWIGWIGWIGIAAGGGGKP